MVASNELDADYFVETASILFGLAAELRAALGIHFDFINLGGGIGIPYRPEEDIVDLGRVSAGIRVAYDRLLASGHPAPSLRMESGRMVAGPYGWLVSRVLHVKRTYRTFVGLDACMANLMRPALYGAYHHISVPGKRLAGDPGSEMLAKPMLCDLTGSLCENNDKFAIQRKLPPIGMGDFVLIHDTGAHGRAMGFNYNGKLRSAELLLRPDATVTMIRRAETYDDLFATLEF
jgi:diaminopimelate decarboxylase